MNLVCAWTERLVWLKFCRQRRKISMSAFVAVKNSRVSSLQEESFTLADGVCPWLPGSKALGLGRTKASWWKCTVGVGGSVLPRGCQEQRWKRNGRCLTCFLPLIPQCLPLNYAHMDNAFSFSVLKIPTPASAIFHLFQSVVPMTALVYLSFLIKEVLCFTSFLQTRVWLIKLPTQSKPERSRQQKQQGELITWTTGESACQFFIQQVQNRWTQEQSP